MSRNLAVKGNLDKPVVLWSRTIANAHAHSAEVANTVVETSLEAAVRQADMIWSCLSDETVVAAMFDQVLEHDVRGKLFVECSTVTPAASTALAARVLDAGAEFVAMPGK